MSDTDGPGNDALKTVRCDLCGSGNDATLMHLTDVLMGTTSTVFRLARCRRCGLIYLNPRPAAEKMGDFYLEDYAPFTRQGLSGAARSWLNRRNVAELHAFLAYPRHVVDVGCGNGDLLDAVRVAGNPNVLGIEPSHQAAEIARNRGLSVMTGTLEGTALPDESIDTVLLSHTLEHVPSPVGTIRAVNRVLKPGGAAIVWVPNARSLAADWLGEHWMGWDVPRHLYSFTPATLHRLFSSVGLAVTDLTHERHGLEWAWGLRLWARARSRRGGLERTLKTLHPAMAAGLTPIGTVAAILRRSGRIRVIARKPVT